MHLPIPLPVIAVAADLLAQRHSATRLDVLFSEAGAPGEPPVGNKTNKAMDWLKRTNRDNPDEALLVLGRLLEEIMEVPRVETRFGFGAQGVEAETVDRTAENIQRMTEILARHDLSYHVGGRITKVGHTAISKTLHNRIRGRDWASVHADFARSLEQLEKDPAAAVASACALLESLCKVYIETNRLEMPKKETLKPVWAIVQQHLGLDPASKEDDDVKMILTGIISVADGLGALRTHASSAHGRGLKPYRLQPKHARLAVGSAHLLASLIIETWDEKAKA